jgi:hypothetical protein
MFNRYEIAVWLKPVLVGCFVLLASIVLAGATPDKVLAACSVKIGSGAYYQATFYENECVDAARGFPANGGAGDTFEARSLGYVIPRTSVDESLSSEALAGVKTKDDLYNRLSYHYNTRGWEQKNWWAKDGAAFVVFSLIGKNPPADRNLSDADWDELKRRLDNPALTMELDSNHALSPNSASVYATPSRKLDFAYFSDNYGFTGASFVFKLNGVEVGAIERKCANMLGSFDLPEAAQWTTAGRSKVGVGVGQKPNVQSYDVKPGDTVRWNHRLWNNSSYDMTRSIYWSVRQEGFTYAPSLWRNSSTSPEGWGSGGPGSVDDPFVNQGPAAFDTEYVVRDQEVGNTLCQWLVWTPKAWDKIINTPDALGQSTKACVTVPYDFDLTPSVAPITSAAEPGVTVGPVTPTITNAGPTWSLPGTNWQLSRFIIKPGGAKPSRADNKTAPCTYYGNGCTSADSGSQQFVKGDTVVGQIPSITVDDVALGSQLCYALSISAYNQDPANRGAWRHSDPQCIKIGKKPKLQIWGDDVAVRGSIQTATTRKAGDVFGSWVEYAALSVGPNSQFASGAGLASQTSDAQASWSALTFANANVPGGGFGKYTQNLSVFRPLPSIAQYFSTGKPTQLYNASADLNANAFDTGSSVVVRTAGTLNLNAGELPKGRSLIIVATDTVTIKGNLTYAPGAMTSTRNLSQLVIVAPRIHIEDGVTEVNAWLVADEEVNTCSNAPKDPATGAVQLTGASCSAKLTVNGPVVSGKLILYRTAGSGTGVASGDPAEVFNTRPDAYLWAQLVAAGSGRAETVDTTELPPRF